MYGFDETTTTGGDSTRIAAGIVENATLKDVLHENLKADGSGNMVMKFLFGDAVGGTFTHIEFPIDPVELEKKARGWGKSAPEAKSFVEQEFVSQGERIKHILSCFVPRDKCVFKASSFDDFAKGVITLLGESHKGVSVRIKTVYKKNSSYTTFPKRAFKPFIQPMSEPNKIVIDPKWDIIEAPTPDVSDEIFQASTSSTPAGNPAVEDTTPW